MDLISLPAEIDHQKIDGATAGQEVAIEVCDTVRPGDLVYKILGDSPNT